MEKCVEIKKGEGKGQMAFQPRVTKQVAAIIAIDALLVTLAGSLALLARFDFSFAGIPSVYADAWLKFLPIQIVLTIVMFSLLRMYRYVWRSVSAQDVAEMILVTTLTGVVCDGLSILLGLGMPRSVQFISLVLQVSLLTGERCILRFYDAFRRALYRQGSGDEQRIMLIGAGEAGRMLIRESTGDSGTNGRICCVIDDNRAKWGRFLSGVPIVGGREKIADAARERNIDQIILAIPSLGAKEKKAILEICQQTGCRMRVLPEIYKMMSSSVSMADVKDVQMEDLLGREPVKLDTAMLSGFLHGKTVLVTGGGGSIGSELCRQIAPYGPKRLVILDIYENNAYDIQQELLRTYGWDFPLSVEIASVRDKEKVYKLVQRYRPDIIFHAAAHKHVPLMEDCAEEAVKNNIFGTYHVVRAAEKFGVKKFVMISTDKAVNPTNFMGATKRFCEMILQSRRESPTEFCCVRFGNVLGSNGSVVPLFKQQIAAGGPVTITDKRIIRYFMTIPEAAQLVLEAGAMARQSQIFVLDMGEPVKILSLAENLIRLSGLEPYKDIEIKEIGLRPGEKLYEELLMRSETLSATPNEKIFVEQQQEIRASRILSDLEMLDRAIAEGSSNEELTALLKTMVPTYYDPDEVNHAVQEREQELVRVG